MLNFKTLDDLKKELLQNPEFKKEYEENKPYYEIAKIIVGSRIQAGLSQKELAQKIGSTQSRVSAWENGQTKGMKIETLNKILKATNNRLILGVQKSEDTENGNDGLAIAV